MWCRVVLLAGCVAGCVAAAPTCPSKVENKCVVHSSANSYGHWTHTTLDACCATCVADGLACVGYSFRADTNGECTVYNAWTAATPATTPGRCTYGLTANFTPPVPPPVKPVPKGARPVVFLMHDDLRPDLDAGGYGLDFGHTPNLNQLASRGVTFRRAYINYPYCAPSRNSFMSGRRPDATKAFSFVDHFREAGVGDQWWSLPELFKNNGYSTSGTGKTFHPGVPPFDDAPRAWSPQFPYHEGTTNATNLCDHECCGADGEWVCQWDLKPNTVLQDMDVMNTTVQRLAVAAKEYKGKPFAFFVGTHKPHLRWDFPRHFFDNIPDNVSATLVPQFPATAPAISFHSCAEMSAQFWDTNGDGKQDRSLQWQALMRRSYYACISYVDSLIGQLLDALAAFGVADDTVVVTTGDHGWNLGTHDLWCKMCINENTARVPLIIADPAKPASHGQVTYALAELVDVYPTLADLAGVPLPTGAAGEYLTGKSLAPVLDDPTHSVKSAVLSQMARCWQNNTHHDGNQYGGPGDESNSTNSIDNMSDCHWTRRDAIDFMGYALRTDAFRYVEWVKWDGSTLQPDWTQPMGVELYNHTLDRGTADDFEKWENSNLATDKANAALVRDLSKQLHELVESYITPNP